MIKGGGWYNFKRSQRVVFVTQSDTFGHAVIKKADNRWRKIEMQNCQSLQETHMILKRCWFAPVIEGLLYVEDFTTNWFLRTWPYMEFICTCSSIVNWKIKLIWQRRLLHMSISVEATGKILYLQFVFHMRLVSFEVRSVVTLLKCKLRNELLGF